MTDTLAHSADQGDKSPMQYLSVHDIVWINTTIAGKSLRFDYVSLEEAMAAQYSYGVSTNVPVQAANMLHILAVKRPFAYGNLRTAFVAVAAFLGANGFTLKQPDAEAAVTVRAVAASTMTAENAITELAEPSNGGSHTGATLRSLVTHIFSVRTEAIQLLTAGDE